MQHCPPHRYGLQLVRDHFPDARETSGDHPDGVKLGHCRQGCGDIPSAELEAAGPSLGLVTQQPGMVDDPDPRRFVTGAPCYLQSRVASPGCAVLGMANVAATGERLC